MVTHTCTETHSQFLVSNLKFSSRTCLSVKSDDGSYTENEKEKCKIRVRSFNFGFEFDIASNQVFVKSLCITETF